MANEEIKKKIQGTTWSEVMDDLNKATKKLGSTDEKNSSESGSSSDKT